MKEYPMLFKPDMVSAIREDRKTQTRRLINRLRKFGKITEFGRSETKGYDWTFRDKRGCWNDLDNDELFTYCPYSVGDLLWVREGWLLIDLRYKYVDIRFRAGYKQEAFAPANPKEWVQAWHYYKKTGWQSPLHMPRWACRQLLKITDIRVERIQDISEEDARAEGIDMESDYASLCVNIQDSGLENSLIGGSAAKTVFAGLWDDCYGKDGGDWSENPWVWTYTFEKVKDAD